MINKIKRFFRKSSLLVISFFLLLQNNSWAEGKQRELTKVEVVKLSPRTMKSYSTYIGNLKPNAKVEVSTEVAGIVEKAGFSVGQKVAKGAMLVQIDVRRQALTNKLNQSNYDLALNDYQIKQSLYKKKLTTSAKVNALKNRLDVNKVNLELSRLDLTKSKIRAPISGNIKSKIIEEGEYIAVGKKVLEIFDISKVIAVVNVPEHEIGFVKIGKKVKVTLSATPDEEFTGVISIIDIEADVRSRSFAVEVEMDNPEQKLLPGMLVKVKMLKVFLPNQIIIPRYTIQEEETGSFVYIVEGNKTVKRTVQLGNSLENEIQVLSGLDAGDNIINIGQQLVASGETVKIIKQSTQ
ncbi:efflux RND transporter periplasmic adaptor subunit [bacterium]|nr:efflux RND transporter periplasmic adaptor subunit [bacterium]